MFDEGPSVNIRGGTLASEAGTVDTFAGPIVLNFSSVLGIRADSGSTLHLMGSAISMQGFTLTVGGAGNAIIDDILSGGLSTASLSKIDSGMLTLNGDLARIHLELARPETILRMMRTQIDEAMKIKGLAPPQDRP